VGCSPSKREVGCISVSRSNVQVRHVDPYLWRAVQMHTEGCCIDLFRQSGSVDVVGLLCRSFPLQQIVPLRLAMLL